MDKILIVTTTFSDRQEGMRVAKGAVEQRLAACAQLSGQIESVYWWESNIETDSEFVVTFKTSEEKYVELESFLLETHSYDTPEIVATPATRVSSGYGKWLIQELKEQL